jgi:hypothetical protein
MPPSVIEHRQRLKRIHGPPGSPRVDLDQQAATQSHVANNCSPKERGPGLTPPPPQSQPVRSGQPWVVGMRWRLRPRKCPRAFPGSLRGNGIPAVITAPMVRQDAKALWTAQGHARGGALGAAMGPLRNEPHALQSSAPEGPRGGISRRGPKGCCCSTAGSGVFVGGVQAVSRGAAPRR